METVYVLEKAWIYPAGGFDCEVWEIVSISRDLDALRGDHEWSSRCLHGLLREIRVEGNGLGRTEWRIREFPVE